MAAVTRKRLFGPSLLVVLAALASPTAGGAESAALTILHTNDTHGRLLPFRYPANAASTPGFETLPAGVELGGIARRATLVRRIREEQAARDIPVWLVDAGDFTDGTAFTLEYGGKAELEAMAAAGYMLGAIGNHELNRPLAKLRELLASASYPLLCANVFVGNSGETLTTPSLVRQAGALRVGVFGLLTRDAADYPAAREGLRVEDEVATARRMARALRTQADVVVLVSHAGRVVDERIGAAVPEIDVIVGGHSHSRLPSGELIWRGGELSVDDVGGAVLVQAHQWGGELGRLDLLFAKDGAGRWRVTRYRASLIPVTADIPEDPAVAAAVERFWRPIAARYGEVVGHAAGDFAAQGSDQAEYNLVADAMRAALGTRVHLENQGGVRAPLVKGPVTLADIVEMDPFDNSLVTFGVKGHQLRGILEQFAPAVSGLRYRLEGQRLAEATVAGRPLGPSRTYLVSTNSYLARKIAAVHPGLRMRDTGRSRRETLVAYVRAQKTIHPSYDGRRVVLDAP
jgi:2',3'-cyclic-nucleotide 2'-phosphodiesterase (5'-nucleotidase family)